MAEKKIKARGFPRLTQKQKDDSKKRALAARASWTPAYQLGFYVGEEIVHRFLPTLSVDAIHTKTNISVTAGEGDECRRLNDVWYRKTFEDRDNEKHSEAEWKALRAYHEMLEEKYLPKKVECHFRLLNIADDIMEDFKKGVGVSLWDCDCSHYSTKPEDIDVKADEDGWFTIITLKKD